MKKLLNLLCLSFLLSSVSFAEPLVVNIDNPTFRKLILAVPLFQKGMETDPAFLDLVKQGEQDFNGLLKFTGLFNIMSTSASPTVSSSTSTDLMASRAHIVGFGDIDTLYWKTIGVESLIIVQLSRQPDKSIRVSMRTADLNQLKPVLNDEFVIKTQDEFYQKQKQYIDKLLLAYTGKPGIFSSKIVFLGKETPTSLKHVYTCDIDGRNIRKITQRATSYMSPSWNPSGKQLVYTALEAKKGYHLYFQDLTVSRSTLLAGSSIINSGGAFSPNGQAIVYSSYDDNKKETQLYSIKLLKGNRRELLYAYQGRSQGGRGTNLVDPSFSPDGKWLSYVSDQYGDPHLFRKEVTWKDGDLVLVGEEKRLTYDGWFNTMPAWSPDSKKMVFSGLDRSTKRFDIYMMNMDGTQLERLTLERGNNESPTFSPNGMLVLFQSNRIGTSNVLGDISKLYIMNRDGSDQRIIQTGLYTSESPEWGPPM